MTQTYIVIGSNQDEMGRGTSRPVSYFTEEAEAKSYVQRYIGNSSSLEIYKATRLTVRTDFVEVPA